MGQKQLLFSETLVSKRRGLPLFFLSATSEHYSHSFFWGIAADADIVIKDLFYKLGNLIYLTYVYNITNFFKKVK